jgi:TrmH family RNA methyltransferase
VIHRISSRSNQKLKSLLAQRDQYFFFEGEKLVKDLLKKNESIFRLIINQEIESRFKIPSKKVDEIWYVNDSVLRKVSSLKERSNLIAVVKYKPKKIDFGKLKLGIVLDNVQDPGNAGTVFRCASAFGIDSIFFSGNCVNLINPKLLRTAQTAVFDVSFQQFSQLEMILEKCLKKNINVYLTSADSTHKGINIKDIKAPCVVIFGNEGKGLEKDYFSRFPSIRISHKNTVESLNVGVSTCIVMYELSNLSVLKS